MKMNRIVAALLCLMLVLPLCLTASAETAVTSNTISAYDVSLDETSKRLIIRFTSNAPYTLCDLDGNPLTDAAYTSMRESGYDYDLFEVKVDNGTANNIGVIDVNGAVILPVEYGDIKYLSNRWVMGVVLEPSTEEHYDYKTYGSEKQFFLISRYDVYYMGTKVGELGRTDYNYGSAYGAYVIIQNELGEKTGYDSAFNKSPYAIRYSSEYEYDYQSKVITHVCSGLPAFTEGCELKAEDVSKAYYEMNDKLYDLQGNLVADLSAYNYSYDVDNGYLYVKNSAGKYGIIDINGNVVIDTVLDEKLYTHKPMFSTGYQLVAKDGKLCYATTEGIVFTSKVNSSVSYTQVGVFTHTENADGTRSVFTPLGQLPDSYKSIMYASDNTGMIMTVQNTSDEVYVIGMGGEVVIPADSRADSLYDYEVSSDGTIVLVKLGRNNNRLYDFAIYHVDYDASALDTAVLESGSWNCECGYVNDNNYCPFCGRPNPRNAQ